jgi:hypothetical protein
LDKRTTYHKSAKGVEAIVARNARLSPKQRSMLILIDGRRSYDDLAKLGQGLGDPALLMSQLEADGFIEPGPPREGPATGPAPLFATSGMSGLAPASGPAPLYGSSHPAPLAPVDLRVPLGQAQRLAVRKLHDLLGPAGDDLCMRIENTSTPTEFTAAIRSTETVLRQMVGPELAAQFVSEVERHRVS